MPTVARLFRRHHTSALNIILFGVAAAWLACQLLLPADHQPPILTQALQAVFGAWLTNLAYEQRNKEDRIEKRVDSLEQSDIGGRVETLESEASTSRPHGLADVIDVQERELTANRAALQLMREAVVLKEVNGVPVLPETRAAIVQLEQQIKLLARDIAERRRELAEDTVTRSKP